MHIFLLNLPLLLRALLAAVTLALLVMGSGAPLWAQGDDDDDDDDKYGLFVPEQIVVKLNQSVGVTVDEINATYQTTTLKTYLSSAGIYLLHSADNDDIPALLEQMKADSRLLYAEPNFVGQAPEEGGRGTKAWGGEDDAPYGDQYALELLGIPGAHEVNRGAGTIVAVLDTGIQADHPIFTSTVTPTRLTAARYDFVDDDDDPADVGNMLDDDGNGEIDEGVGHGTHVAGIVALAAPDAQIMPLRVLDSDGRGNVFLIAEAIFYAAQQGADVINLSLGTSDDSALLAEMIADAVETHEMVVVAAAGNLNLQSEQYPAAVDDVLAVTAINAERQKWEFSNHGSWIDVAAPGVSIYSAAPPNGYAWWTGTSMAAPFVAGQAALLRSDCPALTSDEIVARIQDSARSLDDQNPDYSGKLGKGLPDFAASLNGACEGGGGGDDDDDDDDDNDDNDEDGSAGENPGIRDKPIFLPFLKQRQR